jgi:hypothetical protein
MTKSSASYVAVHVHIPSSSYSFSISSLDLLIDQHIWACESNFSRIDLFIQRVPQNPSLVSPSLITLLLLSNEYIFWNTLAIRRARIAQSVYRRATDSTAGVWFRAEAGIFLFSVFRPAHPTPYQLDTGKPFLWSKTTGGVKLTVHFHLVAKSRSPTYVFKKWWLVT